MSKGRVPCFNALSRRTTMSRVRCCAKEYRYEVIRNQQRTTQIVLYLSWRFQSMAVHGDAADIPRLKFKLVFLALLGDSQL